MVLYFAFLAWVLLGMIPAAIANNKGHSPMTWWFYGAMLFPIAFLHALLVKPNDGELAKRAIASGTSRVCPFCAELIRKEAVVCRYCRHSVPVPVSPVQTPPTPPVESEEMRVDENSTRGWVVVGLICGAAVIVLVVAALAGGGPSSRHGNTMVFEGYVVSGSETGLAREPFFWVNGGALRVRCFYGSATVPPVGSWVRVRGTVSLWVENDGGSLASCTLVE